MEILLYLIYALDTRRMPVSKNIPIYPISSTDFHHAIAFTVWACWLFGLALYLAAVVFLCLPSVRQSLISGKALAVFKKVLPAMSQTEKEALEAGTVWWEAELFKGNPDWKSCTISKLRSCLMQNKPSWMAQSMKCVPWLATTKSPMNWQIYRQKCGLSSKRRNSSP